MTDYKETIMKAAFETMFDPTTPMVQELLNVQIMTQRSTFCKTVDYLSEDEKKSYIFTGKLPSKIDSTTKKQ